MPIRIISAGLFHLSLLLLSLLLLLLLVETSLSGMNIELTEEASQQVGELSLLLFLDRYLLI